MATFIMIWPAGCRKTCFWRICRKTCEYAFSMLSQFRQGRVANPTMISSYTLVILCAIQRDPAMLMLGSFQTAMNCAVMSAISKTHPSHTCYMCSSHYVERRHRHEAILLCLFVWHASCLLWSNSKSQASHVLALPSHHKPYSINFSRILYGLSWLLNNFEWKQVLLQSIRSSRAL
jgi:hypothetical protein